jgi:hypothetical protein
MQTEDHRVQSLKWLADHFRAGNRVGWIGPDGGIAATELWYHLQYFIDNETACGPVFAFLRPHWEDFNEPLLEDFRASGRRWHEWVDVPMTVEGEIAAEAKSIAYANGWGRIGTFGDNMELECFEEHRRRLSRYAKEFAELLSRELVVNVAQPFRSAADPLPAGARW